MRSDLSPMQRALGQKYAEYRRSGERARLFAQPLMAMSTDDLCAAIGWLLESNAWWREFSTDGQKICTRFQRQL
jgi:hypothetical protein